MKKLTPPSAFRTPPSGDRGLNVLLTTEEKQKLAILAAQAHGVMARAGATDEHVDEFRHRIALQACGRRISEATRRDFNDIKAAFLVILGHTKAALNAADRASTEGSRIALHKLRAALAEHGLHEGYAESICRRQFKCGLHEASAKQLWNLFYTVTNRGRSKERQSHRAAAD